MPRQNPRPQNPAEPRPAIRAPGDQFFYQRGAWYCALHYDPDAQIIQAGATKNAVRCTVCGMGADCISAGRLDLWFVMMATGRCIELVGPPSPGAFDYGPTLCVLPCVLLDGAGERAGEIVDRCAAEPPAIMRLMPWSMWFRGAAG